MKIGLLRETKMPVDTRVPLIPQQCRMIREEFPGVEVVVQPSSTRCYSDAAYRKEGMLVVENLEGCDVLLGIKEVDPAALMAGKTYFFFSHTIKKQPYNKKLLKTVLEKHIKLIDYEILTDSRGIRIIGFGRWAGLIGAYEGMRAMCIRHKIPGLLKAAECAGIKDVMNRASQIPLPPWRIALTGDGRVAGGVEEMMLAFGVRKVTVEDYLADAYADVPVYVQLDSGKYNKRKDGAPFELLHFFEHPAAYESNFARFCNKTDLLIMAAYWDPRAPVLFTPMQMKEHDFRIRVIADITCDIQGAIPSTLRASNFQEPFYDFNPATGKEEKAFSNESNITVMAIDNLPSGLPREASEDFGHNLIKNVFSLVVSGDPERVIDRATIAENGKLTKAYQYLSDWVNQQD
ncbi:MAG: NAD(P)-dependent oxidoreductase [Bacteroidales bacterium]